MQMLRSISVPRSLVPAAAVALAVGLPAGSTPATAARPHRADPPGVLTVGGPLTRRAIPPGFLGLSFEYWAVPDYAGRSPRRLNPVFLQLIRNLAGGSEPELRIGGVTT